VRFVLSFGPTYYSLMTHPARQAAKPLVGAYPAPELERLRALSRLLDSAFRIPGTGVRFGLDSLIGLVPGLGDAIGAIFSGYLILQASRLGAPQSVIARMIANVGIDTAIGWVPVLGDLFDVGWKANNRNFALLEKHVERPVAARAASRRSLLLLGAGFLVFSVLIVAAGVLVAQLILDLLQR
jgi:hypothetical protein